MINFSARKVLPSRLLTPLARYFVSIAALLAISPLPSESQRPTCDTCRIRLTHLVTIGADAKGPLITQDSKLLRLSSGGYVLAGTVDPGVLFLLNEKGVIVRSAGRVGSGPGEYRRVALVVPY